MQIDIGPAETVKRSDNSTEAGQLAVEAEHLSRWSHPGLVRLIRRTPDSGPSADEIVTATATAGSLAQVVRPPLDLLAGWGAAVATVLGDLHSVGLAHGDVAVDHILLDADGRPVLCSLGRAVRATSVSGEEFDAACAGDLVALASLLAGLAPPGRDTDRMTRRLARWERKSSSSGSELASALLAAVPSARVGLPEAVPAAEVDPEVPADPASGGGSAPQRVGSGARRVGSEQRLWARLVTRMARCGWQRGAAVGAGAVVLIGIGVVLVGSVGRHGSSVTSASLGQNSAEAPSTAIRAAAPVQPAPPGPAGPPPAASGSSAPDEMVSDIIPGYKLKTPDAGRALTVLGRWGCGDDRPAVLYLGDGSVWVFASWPANGTAIGAVEKATVSGATGLAVEYAGDGCDDLVVIRGNSSPVTIDPGRGR